VFRIEFLLDEPAFQAHHAPYIKNLGVLELKPACG
jgi:microcin C transport system substrate-binding protein